MRNPADGGVIPAPPASVRDTSGAAEDHRDVESVSASVRQLNQAATSQIERAERTLRLIHSGDDEPSVVTTNARAPLQFVPVAKASSERRTPRWLMPVAALGAISAVAGVAFALQVPDMLGARQLAGDGQTQAFALTEKVANAVDGAQGAVRFLPPLPLGTDAGGNDVGQSIYAAHFKTATGVEQQCLAKAIYYEARGEPYEGQVAVAQVIVNRVRSQRWPDSICGVVHQGETRGEKCQFSFVCQRSLADTSGPMWDEAQALATEVLAGRAWLREAVDATHYHTTKVAPVWRQDLVAIVTIGNHIFYRDPDGLRAGVKPYAPEAAPMALAAAARHAEVEKAAARAKAVSAKAKIAEATKSSSSGSRGDGDWKLNAFGN
jgi:Cell Wall Hydrolase